MPKPTHQDTVAASVPRANHELDALQNSGDVQRLLGLLEDKEVIARLVMCTYDGHEAVLAATNKRIIFCDKRFIGSEVMSYQYKQIAVVIYNPELIAHKLTLAHAEGALSVDGVDLKHGHKLINYIEPRIGANYASKGKNGRAFEHVSEEIELNEVPSQ